MAAIRKTFARAPEILVVVCLLSAAFSYPLCAQQAQGSARSQYVITRIEFDGNRRVQRDTLLARIFSKPGDPYSPDVVRRDFQALWNTQFFEDITLEVQDDPNQPNGKIVIF